MTISVSYPTYPEAEAKIEELIQSRLDEAKAAGQERRKRDQARLRAEAAGLDQALRIFRSVEESAYYKAQRAASREQDRKAAGFANRMAGRTEES